MNTTEAREKAIREYEEEYAKFSAEFERGSDAIGKLMEYCNTDPEKVQHYKAILDETVANQNAMAERFIEVCGAAYYYGHSVDMMLWRHAVKALYYLRTKI